MNNVKDSCATLKDKPSKENLTPNSQLFEFEYWASAVKEQMLIVLRSREFNLVRKANRN
jgi:hypothetical protein